MPLPAERLALPAAGQEIWSEAARLLADTPSSQPRPERLAEIRGVLAHIAADDFALLHRAPPLVYHNDMSSPAERVYWSPDFGLALWLRLYDAVGVEAARQARRP